MAKANFVKAAQKDIYERGKYVSDGNFDPNAVDRQLGCAGLILALQQLDQSIKFAGETIPPPPDIEVPTPVPPEPTFFVLLLKFIIGLFMKGK